MNDTACVDFLQEVLPCLHLRWPGFRKIRKQAAARLRIGGYLVIGKHELLPTTALGFNEVDQRLPIFQLTAQAVPKAA